MENRILYDVDLVICIDITNSMNCILDLVKNNATRLYGDIEDAMKEKDKHITNFRIRVIAFRDYVADGKEAMLATNFFNMPEDQNDFQHCLNSIHASGGGDEPEDGLEALAYAMKSDWNKNPNSKKKHVIVVWTDASTHPIQYGKEVPNYPKGMPENFNELSKWWGVEGCGGLMNQYAKRLVLFAPDMPYWNKISKNWDNVLFYPSKAGEGLQEYDYRTILNIVTNSIS